MGHPSSSTPGQGVQDDGERPLGSGSSPPSGSPGGEGRLETPVSGLSRPLDDHLTPSGPTLLTDQHTQLQHTVQHTSSGRAGRLGGGLGSAGRDSPQEIGDFQEAANRPPWVSGEIQENIPGKIPENIPENTLWEMVEVHGNSTESTFGRTPCLFENTPQNPGNLGNFRENRFQKGKNNNPEIYYGLGTPHVAGVTLRAHPAKV